MQRAGSNFCKAVSRQALGHFGWKIFFFLLPFKVIAYSGCRAWTCLDAVREVGGVSPSSSVRQTAINGAPSL